MMLKAATGIEEDAQEIKIKFKHVPGIDFY